MKIVLLNDAANIRGGADRVAFDSAIALAQRGHQVTLLTAFGPVMPELTQVPGLTVHCLGIGWLRNQQRSPRAMLRGLWNRDAAHRLRQILRPLDPAETVVHAHLYSSALTASVLHAARTAGYRTALTLHDYFITCPNGAYFVFPKAALCERRALSASCLACHCDSRHRLHKFWRVARTVMQNQVARLPRRLDGYLAVSQTCANLARRDLPARARVEVLANIVAINQAPPVRAAEHRAYVFTGRLESYKGPQLLAAAGARLGLPVVFCGTGPMEAELRRLYPNARFTGWLSPDALVQELDRARAFVFPSVYRETFGLSAAEALARGLPVVASRGTAAEEFVHHGRNGLLFNHNSVDDLTARLAELQDDEPVRRMGAQAYIDYWADPLTTQRHLDRLETFYRSLLSLGDRSVGARCSVVPGVVGSRVA